MPLRDHFHAPLIHRKSWDGLHAQWPAMIVLELSRLLPARYAAAPNVHLGSAIEVDVGTFEEDNLAVRPPHPSSIETEPETSTWAPPEPNLVVMTDLLDVDEYEVFVYDTHPGRRLVAAIEIVSPSNKDRPEHRRAFVAKCAGLLKDHVSLTIIDLVTIRSANLLAELFDFIGEPTPLSEGMETSIYASACRWTKRGQQPILENWTKRLTLGQALPTLPLWLAENHAVPLDLEASYEETCRVLRVT